MASKKLKLDSGEEIVEGQETERGDWDGLPQEVLNMIFNHLPVADLLSSSVVSKNWKKASRDVLKRCRECYAHIKDFPQDVQELSDMIASKDFTQMFNGLNINLRSGDKGRSTWREDFSCSYAENRLQSKQTRQKLERAKRKLRAVLCGQWKYLHVDMGYYWKQVLSVDDALLLRELISATSESLLKLVVGEDQDCDFMSCCGKAFSKLKVLQTQNGGTVEESCMEQFVLEFAPNLEEITGEMAHVEVHSPGNPFMLKCMKSILIAPDVVIPEAGLMEGFRFVSGLYRLDLQHYQCRNSDDVSILYSMVLKSLNTLEELYMCTLEFYDLSKTPDELKFPNLRRLSLATLVDETAVLKLLNLPKLCPNLKQIELSVDECDEDYEEVEGNRFEEPCGVDKSDRPLQITLQCCDGLYRHEHLEFLSQIYPKANKVKVLEWEAGDNSELNNIFSDLLSLEYFEIDFSDCYSDYDSDLAIAAILCGINVHEAMFLLSRRPKKNANLNPYIVPIYPSVFNAKNLKELKIIGEGNHSGEPVSHSWVIQITENLPVRHVRNLTVTFEGSDRIYKELNERVLTTLFCAHVKDN